MPVWTDQEHLDLRPLVDAVIDDLGSLDGKRILVLCSAAGDVAVRIAERSADVEVIGLEYDDRLLTQALSRHHPQILFQSALMDRIPFPDGFFDGVVSEFIVYPTSQATDISQLEMARVLGAGGVMTITDVIVPSEPPSDVRMELEAAGLDYVCVATPEEFERWMREAGLVDIAIEDVTPFVLQVWDRRAGSAAVLQGGPWALGGGLTYIKVRGMKP